MRTLYIWQVGSGCYIVHLPVKLDIRFDRAQAQPELELHCPVKTTMLVFYHSITLLCWHCITLHAASLGGCLVLVPNYTGDRLNFGIGMERGMQEGLNVSSVTISEDCATTTNDKSAGRRGLCGMFLVIKVIYLHLSLYLAPSSRKNFSLI